MAELLEIRDAGGAFERLGEWLGDRGFFASGGEDLVADLDLGFGLLRSIRRTRSPAPPEPCPGLPLAACRVRAAGTRAKGGYEPSFAIGQGVIYLWVEGGIVWDSDPTEEVEESWVKARPLLAAVGSPLPGAVTT